VSVARRITGEDIRASLGLWPVVGAAVSFVLTLLLLEVRVPDGVWARLAWPGDVASATALLQVVASSVIAATTLIFSLTVVALQLASQQFSPRLLREFARDRFTQFVLTVLVCTFVVALTGLRGMRADAPIPRLVVALSLVLGIVSVGLLLVFLGHVVRSLRRRAHARRAPGHRGDDRRRRRQDGGGEPPTGRLSRRSRWRHARLLAPQRIRPGHLPS
jgi:uncharacterized membrane protein